MLRRLAAALLLAAFGAFLLQATARPGLAAGMALDQPAMAGHGCDHARADTNDTQARSTSACSASITPDDCCQQLCTAAALLPQAPSVGGSPGAEVPAGSWPDRSGRSPSTILRPPRIPAVA